MSPTIPFKNFSSLHSMCMKFSNLTFLFEEHTFAPKKSLKSRFCDFEAWINEIDLSISWFLARSFRPVLENEHFFFKKIMLHIQIFGFWIMLDRRQNEGLLYGSSPHSRYWHTRQVCPCSPQRLTVLLHMLPPVSCGLSPPPFYFGPPVLFLVFWRENRDWSD